MTAKSISSTVDGPRGRIHGALVAGELHDDGSFSDKIFAPGYGEFFSAHEGDIEALALAVPTDALKTPMPRELARLTGLPAVSGDVATLEWIRDRIAHTLDSVSVTRLDTHLGELRANVGDEELGAAARTAKDLRKVVARARTVR